MVARLRIPAAYPNLEFANDGGLIAYSTDARPLFQRAAGRPAASVIVERNEPDGRLTCSRARR